MGKMKFAGLNCCLTCVNRNECDRIIKSVMREGCNLYVNHNEVEYV